MISLRDLIKIPDSVEEGDFVVRAAEGADLASYVVTDQLKDSFADALKTVEHALSTGRSQAKFLHGSFGSGKSHFMAVLREILHHNRQVPAEPGLDEITADTDRWLPGKKLLTLTHHMLDARMGDADFFAALGEAGTEPGSGGGGLAAYMARKAGWTAETYAKAAAAHPGTPERDGLQQSRTDNLRWHDRGHEGAHRSVPWSVDRETDRGTSENRGHQREDTHDMSTASSIRRASS